MASQSVLSNGNMLYSAPIVRLFNGFFLLHIQSPLELSNNMHPRQGGRVGIDHTSLGFIGTSPKKINFQ